MNGQKNTAGKPNYDLSEEASRRPGSEKATELARRAESDDANEETGIGQVDEPKGPAEDRVWTSASED